jgi:hypothetical protein
LGGEKKMRNFACSFCGFAVVWAFSGSVAAPAAGAETAACAKTAHSWATNGPWDTKRFGNYLISSGNFNGTPGQTIWANSERCFGVTTTSTVERGGVGSYPHVVRGWTHSDPDLRAQSSPGTFDWTTKSGMGISVTALTKAKIHWAFTAPTSAGSRWMALMDIYFHKTANPAASDWPPFVDLMIDQSIADVVIKNTTYFTMVAGNDHATTVTLGANTYLVYIDDPGETSFHQPGGHNIHLHQLPTSYTGNAGALWGVSAATTDLAAIVKYLMQASPKDDAGRPLLNAAGVPVTSPLIAPDLILNAINAGWEVDVGTVFETNNFWTALQNEPDGQ